MEIKETIISLLAFSPSSVYQNYHSKPKIAVKKDGVKLAPISDDSRSDIVQPSFKKDGVKFVPVPDDLVEKCDTMRQDLSRIENIKFPISINSPPEAIDKIKFMDCMNGLSNFSQKVAEQVLGEPCVVTQDALLLPGNTGIHMDDLPKDYGSARITFALFGDIGTQFISHQQVKTTEQISGLSVLEKNSDGRLYINNPLIYKVEPAFETPPKHLAAFKGPNFGKAKEPPTFHKSPEASNTKQRVIYSKTCQLFEDLLPFEDLLQSPN